MARTDTLGNFLTDVADAIRDKAGTSEPIQASTFDTAIENLPSGADLSEYFQNIDGGGGNVVQCGQWIRAIKKIKDIQFTSSYYSLSEVFKGFNGTGLSFAQNPNTASTEIFSSMFSGCVNLTDLDLSNLDISSATNTAGMFSFCFALEELDASSLDTGNVIYMSMMFYQAKKLKTLNVSGWDTTSVQNMSQMFQTCSELTTLDLSSFHTPALRYTGDMFSDCKKLMHLDLRNFDFTVLTSYDYMFGVNNNTGVPNACEIIVADATQKSWMNTKFSRFTNVKTVAEYEA